MTRLIRHALLLAALLLAVAAPSAATAASAGECQATIDTLSTATAAATFAGKQADKEEAGLLRTLDAASETLDAGKLDDTIKKLTDFRLHAVTIGQAGKLDPSDAAHLAALADEAIACVSSIGA